VLVHRSPVSVLGPLRRPAPAVVAVALVVATALGVWYAGDPVAGRVDQRTESLVDSVTGDHWRVFARLVQFGAPLSVMVWAALIAGAALLLHRPRHAVLAIVGPGVTGLATTALKPVIGRTFADYSGYAYPSGHTGGATSIALAAALLVIGLAPTRRAVAVTVVASAALLAGGVVGTGMFTLCAHYPTDTVGGFCFAVAIGLGAGMVIDRVADRRAARAGRPPAPAPG
jgi:membrane-associated phospholipid phosphatase